MTPRTARELPAPLTAPLPPGTGALGKLAKRERALADQALGPAAVFVAVRTGARVDTGSWLRRRRVWAFALGRELLLLAAGKAPYVERIPFAHLRESVYNPVTGRLALAPADGVRVRRLAMAPRDGYQMLAQIHRQEGHHAQAPP